jgi:aspartyl-tRNA(Asn)/glutamyl-tRNA(Gln) amidotransferase subunit B
VLQKQSKQRYIELGLEGEQADIFVEDVERGDWFDAAIAEIRNNKFEIRNLEKELAKWVVGDISGQLEKRGLAIKDCPINQKDLIELIKLVKSNQISGTIAKDVINEIFENGGKVVDIIKEKNLIQISDSSEVEKFVKQVIDENPKLVADLAKNPNVIKALVGQMMKLSQGKVNPKVAEEELRKILNI